MNGFQWVDATEELPDADITVLVAGDFDGQVWLGYFDGEDWQSVEGGKIDVTHWAEVPSPPVEVVV